MDRRSIPQASKERGILALMREHVLAQMVSDVLQEERTLPVISTTLHQLHERKEDLGKYVTSLNPRLLICEVGRDALDVATVAGLQELPQLQDTVLLALVTQEEMVTQLREYGIPALSMPFELDEFDTRVNELITWNRNNGEGQGPKGKEK